MRRRLWQWLASLAWEELYVGTLDGKPVAVHTTYQGAAEDGAGVTGKWEVTNVDLFVD